MATAARTVRRLRLTAPSEAAVRHVMPTLEDALRCASLPDDDARVRVVRRLALGRIAPDISPQALSQLIERRVAESGGPWVQGGTPSAEGAARVSFASPLDARTQLALRLLRGEECSVWYWPLAVPEFARGAGLAANLRRMAQALADRPEARVAWPAWVASLVRDGAGATLAMAIDAQQGDALLRQARIALPRDEPVRHAPWPATETRRQEPVGDDSETQADAAPVARWIRAALRAAGAPVVAMTGPARERAAIPIEAAAVPTLKGARDSRRAEPGDAASERAVDNASDSPLPRARLHVRGDESRDQLRTAMHEADSVATPLPAIDATALLDVDGESHPHHPPTCAAGLLFLLPLLARLGLADWLERAGDAAEGFASRVLRAALQRLTVPTTDPAWTLVDAARSEAAALNVPAPSRWNDPLLAPPRGAFSLASALAAAASADAQAAVWLAAARRWLRRAGRIGLASLVLRPARLSITLTHVDIHFRIDDTDLRVRRLGLDIDPGWLPWFGVVVSFHYRERVA